MMSPWLDGAAVGGLSIVGMTLAFTYGFLFEGSFGTFVKSDFIVLAILINAPHFRASYRLLYHSRKSIVASPWAAIYVPLILLALLVYRMLGPNGDQLADGILVVASVYLAVHYTGQAWGMVASYGYLLGTRFEPTERLAIRSGMWALLVLHALIALDGRGPFGAWLSPEQGRTLYAWLFRATCVVAGLSIFSGLFGFLRAHRRGDRVPMRAVLPWLSLYFWYPTWLMIPGGPLWVQLSHALQYLAFPMRVEANRFRARSDRPLVPHLALVYLVLVLAGIVFLKGPPLMTRMVGPGWYSEPWMRDGFGTFVLLINIHHFFIDGALWKLRNPEVRRDLFAHLRARERVGESV